MLAARLFFFFFLVKLISFAFESNAKIILHANLTFAVCSECDRKSLYCFYVFQKDLTWSSKFMHERLFFLESRFHLKSLMKPDIT